ncbi:M12 family metallo-peptidase [Modestobacter versicolor]|uniref:M12 family metallo-peptidase n=1 Tax=Modestobacter versicolor TaxID=429133 RepID=UPI0034DF5DB4
MRLVRRSSTSAVAVVAAVLATFALPSPARAEDLPDPGDTVVGQLVRAYAEPGPAEPGAAGPHAEEHGEGHDDGLLTWVQPASGDAVRVDTEALDHVPVGATVSVTVGEAGPDEASAEGLEEALDVVDADVVARLATERIPTAQADAPANHLVTIVMLQPAGAARDATTLAQVQNVVSTSVATFWRDQTGGRVRIGLAPTAVDWFQGTSTCQNPNALWAEAAAKAGWTYAPGRHLLVYVPYGAPGCAYGLGEVRQNVDSGGQVYVTAAATSVIAHELGHNFGLNHSSALQCGGAVEGAGSSCQVSSYRDYYDVMGISWSEIGSLSALQAAQLGVLPSTAQATVTPTSGSGTFTLSPSSGATGTRGLKLQTASGAVYWVEYRSPTGQDGWLGDPGRNWVGLQSGVLVRRVNPGSGDSSLLLDPTPSAASSWATDVRTALPVGVPVPIAGGAFQLTVQSVAGGAAQVTVGMVGGDAACATRSTPSSGVALVDTAGAAGALVVGLDRGLWLRPLDGSSTSWTSLGGGVLYGPAAATAGTTAYAFVVGTDGTLFYRARTGSGSWAPWTNLGGYLTASPAAASLGPDHVRVFGRGSDGSLWSRELVGGTWQNWVGHGGYLTAPPTATASTASGTVVVAVRGTDGYTYQQSLPKGSGAGTYVRRDVVACSALALSPVSTAADVATAAYLDSAGTPRLLDAAGRSQALTGAFTSNPAVQFPSGGFALVGRGMDNALWFYDGRSGGAGGWVSLGGYVL